MNRTKLVTIGICFTISMDFFYSGIVIMNKRFLNYRSNINYKISMNRIKLDNIGIRFKISGDFQTTNAHRS